MYTYRATIVRVIDGDTVDLDIDLGFHVHVRERVRLRGVNAPELRGESREAGQASRDFVFWWFATRKSIMIQTYPDEREKYGRWLADIYDEQTHESLAAALVAAGHAVWAEY